MRSIKDSILLAQTLAAASFGSASVSGTTVDTKGYDNITFITDVGVCGDTLAPGTTQLQFIMQESETDVDGNFAAVSAADMEGEVSGTTAGEMALLVDEDTDDAQVYTVAYKGNMRYVRGRLVKTGTHSTGTFASVTVVKGSPTYGPAA